MKLLKPLMPILAAAYGTAIIYVTAMPVAGDNPGFTGELLTWLLTLAGIAPFRRRGAQIAVCVVMAFLFGILHVRNFPGAFISALFYGMVFIWSRNIWYSVALHAGCNLTATLLAVYCWLGLGEMQMTKTPVIILPDWKVVVASMAFAIAGVCLLRVDKPSAVG